MNQTAVQLHTPEAITTWGTIPIGEGRVQIRHVALWLGIALWLLPTLIMTGVHGIAWLAFNIAFLIILIAATSTVRSISLHKLTICFFAGGLATGIDLALSVPLVKTLGETFALRHFITVPLEELIKLGTVGFMLFRGRKFSTWTLGATDLLLMGAAVGAGFAFVEDSFTHALQKSALNNLSVLIPASEFVGGRIICGHAVWTALAAGALGIALHFRRQKRLAIPLALLGFTVATTDHLALNYNNFSAAVGWAQSLFNTLAANGYIALALFVLVLAADIIIDTLVMIKNLPAAKEFKFPTGKERKESLLSLWDCIIDLRRLNYAYFQYRQYLNASGQDKNAAVPPSLAMTVAILSKRLVNRYLAAESSSLPTGSSAHSAFNVPEATAETASNNAPGSSNGDASGSSTTTGTTNPGSEVIADRQFQPLSNRPLKEQLDLPERYQLLEEAFRGGMGIVFRARHRQTRAALAIKILQPHLASNSNYLMRFEQEAKAASTLKHPNIVTVHDFGITPNSIAYLVMEWLEGPSLEKVVKLGGPLSNARFVEIFIQTANALAHAHRNGIIHRDIKPSNIILTVSDTSADNVKIVDFGIAKIVSAEDSSTMNLTTSGDLLGSPFFMSPEQCTGGTIDKRTDIYSLGCVMYEALCGVPPLTGQNPAQVYHKHASEMPKQPRTINADIVRPELFEPMLFKCLQKEPDKRYNSMEELEQELKIIRDAL
ncbi:MAG: protein kinase [Cyanobacteria bacterium REEB67]|nr:protein kinase [Cyanobacteria bacterium REEB67]